MIFVNLTVGESAVLSGGITVKFVRVNPKHPGTVRLGVVTPDGVRVSRGEPQKPAAGR